MKIELDLLKISLDKYKRNICIVGKDKREVKNLLDAIKYKWQTSGGLFYTYSKSVRTVLKNREKYSDGQSQVPILVVCSDKLDMSWIFKIQEKAQVHVILVEENEDNYPNFDYQLTHNFERYWNMNGSTFRIPYIKDREVMLS